MPRFLQLITLFLVSALLSAQERDLEWVLDRYIDAAGGRVNLNDLNSVVIEGTLTTPNQPQVGIKVMKKRPDYVRQTMDYQDGRRTVMAYNGERVWQLASDRRDERFRFLEAAESVDFIREARLENPLAAEGTDKNSIRYEGLTNLEGSIECHLLVVTFPDESVAEYYIDSRTFLERKTVKKIQNADGTTMTTETFPSEFEFFNGVLFARRLVMRRDDGISSILEIDQIRINAGVPSGVFDPPPGY